MKSKSIRNGESIRRRNDWITYGRNFFSNFKNVRNWYFSFVFVFLFAIRCDLHCFSFLWTSAGLCVAYCITFSNRPAAEAINISFVCFPPPFLVFGWLLVLFLVSFAHSRSKSLTFSSAVRVRFGWYRSHQLFFNQRFTARLSFDSYAVHFLRFISFLFCRENITNFHSYFALAGRCAIRYEQDWKCSCFFTFCFSSSLLSLCFFSVTFTLGVRHAGLV